jgi:hypothetical protein
VKGLRLLPERRVLSRTSPPSQKARSAPAARAGTLAGDIGVCSRGPAHISTCQILSICGNRHVELYALSVLGCRRVPVVDNLEEEDEVEREACNKAIEDERVVDLLERGENTCERAEKVVDDLENMY